MSKSAAKESGHKTYRAQAIHWAFWGIALVLVPGFVLGITFSLANEEPFAAPVFYSVLIAWVIIACFAVDREILPMWRTFMIISNRGLYGRANRYFYEIYWPEIVAANLMLQQAAPWLWIATRKYSICLPLRHLDAKRIWHQVQQHVCPEKAGPYAYERWLREQGFYEKLSQENAKLIQNADVPLRTRPKPFTIALGWLGLLLFGGCALCSLSLGSSELNVAVFVFSAVFALGLGVLAFPSTVEMDWEGVTHVLPLLGRYHIRWEEIERIECSPRLEWLIFYGNNKRLPITGPSQWSKHTGPQAWAFLQAQIEQRGIDIRRNPTAGFQILPKNTRVKS